MFPRPCFHHEARIASLYWTKKRENEIAGMQNKRPFMLGMMDVNYICYRLFRSSSRPMFRFLYSGGTLSTRAPREYTEKVDGESVSQLRDAVESA
jgi:hypothetical protein